MIHSKKTFLSTVTLLAIGTQINYAQETKEEMPIILPEYVSVSTKTPVEINKISPSVTVISTQQIETEQFTQLSDLLKITPGLEIVQNGGQGSVTSVFIRGAESDHTAITMNGRRLPTGFSHQYNLALLNLDNISSVEIQRGPSSSIWGSDAIGGVINLRTLTSDQIQKNKASVFGEMGTDDTYTARINASGKKDTVFGSVGSSYITTDGSRDKEDYDNVTVTPYVGYQAAENMLLDLQGIFYRSHSGVPGSSAYPGFPADDSMRTTGFFVSPGLTLTPTDDFTAKLIYSHAEDYLDSDGSWSFDKYKTRQDEVSIQGDYQVEKSLLLSLGTGWQNMWQDKSSNSVTAYHNAYDNLYLWGQAQWNITNQINVTASVRQDFYSDYQDPFTASFQASWSTEDGNSVIFAKAANGFKVPTPNDLSYSNGDLSPEKSKSWEVGVRQFFLDKKLNFGLVYFDAYTKNFIDSDPITWMSENLNKVHRNGVEFSVNYKIMEKSRIYGNYTYLHTKVTDGESFSYTEGTRLVRRPMHRFTLGGESNIWEGLTLGASVSASLNRVDVGQAKLEDYTVVRFYGNYRINDHFTVTARAENALDEHYQYSNGYTAPHTQFFLGVSLSL